MSSTRLFPFVTYLSLNFAWVCCIISTQPYSHTTFLKRTLELAHFDTSWMSLLQFMSLICRWSLIIHFVEFALFQPSGFTLLRARGMSWPYPLVFWGAGWEGVGVSVGSKRFPCVITCVTPTHAKSPPAHQRVSKEANACRERTFSCVWATLAYEPENNCTVLCYSSFAADQSTGWLQTFPSRWRQESSSKSWSRQFKLKLK